MNQEGAKLHRKKWLCAFIVLGKCLFILKKNGL